MHVACGSLSPSRVDRPKAAAEEPWRGGAGTASSCRTSVQKAINRTNRWRRLGLMDTVSTYVGEDVLETLVRVKCSHWCGPTIGVPIVCRVREATMLQASLLISSPRGSSKETRFP